MPPKIRAIVAPPFSVTEAEAALQACENYAPPRGTSWKESAQHRAANKLTDLLRAHRHNAQPEPGPVDPTPSTGEDNVRD